MTGLGEGSARADDRGAWFSYEPGSRVFDEAVEGGRVREHWGPLCEALDEIGAVEFRIRQEGARQVLREHEAIHNGRGDNEGIHRPWDLDLVPLVLKAEEWANLERGLLQRTRLMNGILADLYGARRCIESGVLPAEVVQASPAFLRPCDGLRVPTHLFLHGTELGRAPDGGWWVLGDYSEAPIGLGYALEHRGVISRFLPEAFGRSRVRGLGAFCRFMRESLHGFEVEAGEPSKVVLLAGPPGHEDYFEHAYLSRHLGLPLVEGEDLTVRGDRVFLKTLSGLRRVHVVLRVLADVRTDPLELDAASTEGVPGLLEAARAGQVVVANAPGAGLVGMPVILAFLPGLCRFLLGEDLLLPSVATWWSGQRKERDYVLQHLEQLRVHSAYGLYGADRVNDLTGTDRNRRSWASAISQAPGRFVAQEEVLLSRAPTWVSPGLAPWPMRLRAWVCWTDAGAMVLPGGLARVWNPAEASVAGHPSGGAGKDTWVLSAAPVASEDYVGAWTPTVTCERVDAELPSRVADNLFWLGRYMERLEDTVRILRCATIRLRGEARGESSTELKTVARLLVRLDLLPGSFGGPFGLAALDHELVALTRQSHRLGTIPDLIGRLRRIALIVRDRFSGDTWRIFNKLQADPRIPAGRSQSSQAVQLMNTLLFDLAALSGLQLENMTRGPGWRFLDMGRRMERAVNMITLSQAVLELEAAGEATAELMLEIADSAMTYRRRYFAAPQLPAVFDLLWLEGTNPRSLLFQLETVVDHLEQLPEDLSAAKSIPELDAVQRGCAALRAMGLADLVAPRALKLSGAIPPCLAGIARDLRQLSEALTQRYFSHAQTRCSST